MTNSKTNNRTIVFPPLEPWQKEVYDYIGDARGTGRIGVVKSKRQIGKSFLIGLLLIKYCLEKPATISAVIEPTQAQNRRVFQQILSMLEGSGAVASANASILEIEFVNGSRVIFKSGEQGDNIRGFSVSGILCVDECAFIDDNVVQIAFPLADAHRAPVLLVSTPLFCDGLFFDLYIKGLETDSHSSIHSFDWNNYDTSKYLSPEKLEMYRQTFSPQKFKSEYLGEFLSDSGLLFNNLEPCVKTCSGGTTVYIGIDFGTGSEGDYTVLSAVNDNGEQIGLHRTNNLSPMQQVEWLAAIISDYEKRFKVGKILAEKNSIGKVYCDALEKKIKTKLTEWNTTNKSKQDLVTTLQIALENETVGVLPDPIQLSELKRYEAEYNPKTKTFSYNGKPHDDTVIALMLAYYAYKSSYGTYTITFKTKKPHLRLVDRYDKG